jgi:hypothetical protein
MPSAVAMGDQTPHAPRVPLAASVSQKPAAVAREAAEAHVPAALVADLDGLSADLAASSSGDLTTKVGQVALGSLSVGLVAWGVRGCGLIGAITATTAAWWRLDPLLLLAGDRRRSGRNRLGDENNLPDLATSLVCRGSSNAPSEVRP